MAGIMSSNQAWQGLTARMKTGAGLRKLEFPDVVLAVGTISLIVVCLGLLAVPGYHRLQLKAKASAVISNAATLQLAAETYAAAHQGRYAEHALDMLPYLPQGTAPVNPYTSAASSFQGAAGDLTYRSPTRGRDYVIQAFAIGPGAEPRLVATLTGKSPHELNHR
jgi:hypothetical protein